jgi:hypothetical protein
MWKRSLKNHLHSNWNGRNFGALYLNDPDIHMALGVSEELHQQIKNGQEQVMKTYTSLIVGKPIEIHDDPELQKLFDEKQILVKEQQALDNDPKYQKELREFWEEESKKFGRPIKILLPDLYPNAPRALKEGFKKSNDFNGKVMDWKTNAQHEALQKILPPEVKQKIYELLLANMSEYPIVSPNMFEVLNLTDAQRKQMATIKKEHEVEFEKNIEKFVNDQILLANMVLDEVALQEPKDKEAANESAFWEAMTAVQEKMQTEDAEYKRIYGEMQSQGQSFATQYKLKLFDVLTNEQWHRLVDLIDNPPEHAQAFRKRLQLNSEKPGGRGMPDDKPWKVSEAIPQEYRQKRNDR